ncbi:DUF3817 domain-containing protein [Nocardioides sp. B-3]|nr:DUF3817 domain-containing protein [Nocardioides sp. B-3]UUZ61695.1 DUF3817 domain-containing protein [Nocardioides sp. B-3]
MFLKYVTETTELGVRIFGMVHGVVFIAYCTVTVIVAIDQRWSLPRTLLGPGRRGAAVRHAPLRGVRRPPRPARDGVALPRGQPDGPATRGLLAAAPLPACGRPARGGRRRAHRRRAGRRPACLKVGQKRPLANISRVAASGVPLAAVPTRV